MSLRSSHREHREAQWNNRHHVTGSVTNHLVPKQRRAYFDHLPVVGRASGGEFSDIALANPVTSGDVVEHEEQIHRRYRQFPQYWRRDRWPTYVWASAFWEPPPSSRPATADGASTPGCIPGPGCSLPGVASAVSTRASTTPTFRSCSQSPSLQNGVIAGDASSSESQPDRSETPRPEVDQMLKALQLRSASDSPTITGSVTPRSSLRSIGTGAFGMEGHVVVSPGRRHSALLSRTAMAEADDSDQEFKSFIAWVKEKHGHLVRVWHKLDTDGSMLLHKGEFVQGLKRLQYNGNAERLWKLLDRDTTGNISFLEFAPEAALELARFKRWAEKRFGNMQELFQALDEDRSGTISYHEFLSACNRLGLPEELQDTIMLLFLLLDYDGTDGKGTISAEEMHFLDVWKPPPYLFETPDHDARERFQEALLSKHSHNPMYVWRRALDRDASMRVSYEEFVIQCKTLAKKGLAEAAPPGGVSSLYVTFDEDRRGWITLRDWDVEAFETLRDFVGFCREKYGNLNRFMKAAEGMQPDEGEKVAAGGGVPLGMFRRALKPAGFTPAKCFNLFEALQAPTRRRGTSKGHLFPSDISFLAHWDPERELFESGTWSTIVGSMMTTVSSKTSPGGRGSGGQRPGLRRIASLI